MSKPRLMKHNPAFLSKEELLSSFVVRNRELELLLEIVRNNTGPVNQHVIIIAPRGMGKTMLVRRLALEIQQDGTLGQNWYPVLLPEELYDVAGEAELWLRVLQWVGEQEKENDQGRLLNKHAALITEQNDQALKIQALSALLDFADRKRLLIIVENLQMLLGEQSSDDDAWDIRQTLLNHPELMLVTTATTHFGEILNAQKANFELFREIFLAPLDTAACRTLWQGITGEDLKEDRVRPMEILTGGSPRLLAILADFGAGRPLKELMDNLVVLIDDHTTYFKANVEALPNKERRVFVTLAELWEPSRAKDVAERSRMQVNVVSALLKRLVEKGAVTQVDRKGRVHYYQITERLYNIYHLMRLSGSAGDRVKALVRCMVPLYGEAVIACALAKEACHVDGELRSWFIKGYGSILEQTRQQADILRSILENTPQPFFELPEAKYLKPLLGEGVTHEDSTSESALLIERSADLIRQGKFTEGIDVFDQMVERFGQSEDVQLLVLVALALVSKGVALAVMGKPEEAVAVYNSVEERFGHSEDVQLREAVAFIMALVSKGDALRAMGKSEEAVAAYNSVEERFGHSEDVRLLERVAMALIGKGNVLRTMEKSEEAVEAYDSVEERFGHSEDVRLLERVAMALVSKGNVLRAMGKPEEAVAAYESVEERFGQSEDARLLEQVARALFNKGVALEAMEKPEEAVATYESVVERFGQSEDPQLLEPVAMALVSKGAALGATGKPEEAMAAYDSVVERFGQSEDAQLLEQVAMALFNKGYALGSMGKSGEAVATYESVVERFGQSEDARLLEQVAMALFNKGNALGSMGKPKEAVATYESIVERFGRSEDARLSGPVAMAHNGKAWIIYQRKEIAQLDAAIQAAENATRLSPNNKSFRHTLASVYGLAGRWPEAFEQAAIFADDPELIENCPDEILDFFINAAAAGEAEAALRTIRKTAAAASLEPLVAALGILTGADFHAPREVMEVASDIVRKIGSPGGTQSVR